MSKAIGIDLGSTQSEVAIIENGEVVVILTPSGKRTFPSVVGWKDSGERVIGDAAVRQAVVKPKSTINLIKRFMGRRFDDAEVTRAKEHIRYEIVNKNGWPYVKIGDNEYSPQEVSSWIIAELKKMAEEYCGEEIKDAVITVPALFPNAARTATKEAGELAGLNVLRIINEPTAACLASKLDKSGIYMVCDFGGSTLDNSVVDFDKETSTMEILASNGDTFLGGADLDNALVNYIVEEFKNSDGVDLKSDAMAMQRIVEGAEKAKIELSSTDQTEINLPYITATAEGPKHLMMTINKAKFEQLIKPEVDKVIYHAKEAVKESGVEKLDGIILVGGSCRIPYVQNRLTEDLSTPLIKKADLDLAVAQGASIQANILVGNTSDTDITLIDVTPLTLGIDTLGGVFAPIVESNSAIPCTRSQTFSTASDNQTSVQIVVAQGERKMTQDNKVLGTFMLDGIAPARRGVPQIEVIFDIDANGIVTVSAKDKATGKDQHITIQNSAGLTDEEVAKIKADAELHKAEDEKREKEIQTLNQAEHYAYSVEDAIKEAGDKVSEDDKKIVEPLIENLKEVIKSKDVGSVEKSMTELQNAWNPIAQKMYGGASGGDASNNAPNMEDILKNGGFAGFNPSDFAGGAKNDSGSTDTDEVKFESN